MSKLVDQLRDAIYAEGRTSKERAETILREIIQPMLAKAYLAGEAFGHESAARWPGVTCKSQPAAIDYANRIISEAVSD